MDYIKYVLGYIIYVCLVSMGVEIYPAKSGLLVTQKLVYNIHARCAS